MEYAISVVVDFGQKLDDWFSSNAEVVVWSVIVVLYYVCQYIWINDAKEMFVFVIIKRAGEVSVVKDRNTEVFISDVWDCQFNV